MTEAPLRSLAVGAHASTERVSLESLPPVRPLARVPISFGVALIAATIATIKLQLHGASYVAGDFTTFWRGAHALLSGTSPYRVINDLGAFPFDGGFLYPLPAAVTLFPLALIGVRTAMPIFVGVASGILAYALMSDGYWRLPLLMSFPMLWCASSGQWAPLLVAAALMPGWGWIAAIKPTLGAVSFAYGLSMRLVLLAALFLIVTALIWPWWPREWLAEVTLRRASNYRIPLLQPFGIVLLLALLRWRRPEARLLFAMACVPQAVLFYDQLPLALAAQSFRQSLIFGIASYIPYVLAMYLLPPGEHPYSIVFPMTAKLIVALYYLPILAIVLRRPNTGELPEWAEHALRVLSRRPQLRD